MLFLYRRFLGILDIELYGIYPEKFINLCSQNKISIWNIKFKKGKICCKITVSDYKRIRNIFRKKGVRFHILKKSGFPFFSNKYKYRFGVFTGIILFLVLLKLFSSFIWVIEIQGNKNVKSGEILKICQEIGIRQGVKISDIDAKNKAQELLLKCDKLAWASFNVEGCRLTIDLTETKEKNYDNSAPSNLIADSDGIIKYIDVTMGNCIVKVGDTVKKGDVLVSGIIESESGTKYVRSAGTIIADAKTVVNYKQDYNYESEHYIGKLKTKLVLEIMNFKIPLYLGSEKGEYDCEISEKYLKLFSHQIPIKLYKKRFIFKEKQTAFLNYEKACEILFKKAEEDYNNAQISVEFIDKYTYAELNAIIDESRNIAQSSPLILSTEK